MRRSLKTDLAGIPKAIFNERLPVKFPDLGRLCGGGTKLDFQDQVGKHPCRQAIRDEIYKPLKIHNFLLNISNPKKFEKVGLLGEPGMLTTIDQLVPEMKLPSARPQTMKETRRY